MAYIIPFANRKIKTVLSIDMELNYGHIFKVHGVESRLLQIYGFDVFWQELEENFKGYHIFMDEIFISEAWEIDILKKISIFCKENYFWLTITGIKETNMAKNLHLVFENNGFFIPKLVNPLRNSSSIVKFAYFNQNDFIPEPLSIHKVNSNFFCANIKLRMILNN